MTLEEYKKRADEDEHWAPGWLLIDEQFEKIYPGIKPLHYGSAMPARAIFGGNEYLDGLSFYPSPHGYHHLITYGMTDLYVDEEAFGGEWNGWGYEMTMKLTGDPKEISNWAINLMGFLARDTYENERYLEPGQTLKFSGRPLFPGSNSVITDILVVPDTEVSGVDSIHGRTDFLQLVGISRAELEQIREDYSLIDKLTENLRVDYPYLETNTLRDKSYL